MHSAGPPKAERVQPESAQKLKARRLATLAPPRQVLLSLPQPVVLERLRPCARFFAPVYSVAKRHFGLPDYSPRLARRAASWEGRKGSYQKVPQPLGAGTSPGHSPAAATGWKNSRPFQAGCSTGQFVQSLPP